MAIIITIILFVVATIVRSGLGGSAFGLGFWITAGVFLFVVNPLIFSLLKGSRLDSEEMELHHKFVSIDVPQLLGALAAFKANGNIPQGRFVVSAAPRDRKYLRKLGVLGDLDDLEKKTWAAKRDHSQVNSPTQ